MKKTIKKISATAVSALLAACSLGSFPATTASMLTTIEKTPLLINFDISGEGVSIAENEDGEIPELNSIETTTAESIFIPDVQLEREGYIFTCWTADDIHAFEPGDVYRTPDHYAESEITFKPVWVDENDDKFHTVTYIAEIEGENRNEDNIIIPLQNVIAGYPVTVSLASFQWNEGLQHGWTDGTTNFLSLEKFVMPDRDVVFNPIWGMYYTLTYSAGDVDRLVSGSKASFSQPATFTRDLADASRFSRKGFTISGWHCDYDDKDYDLSAPFLMPDCPVTMTAIWKPIRYVVVFRAGTGKASDNIKIPGYTDETITVPELTATKSGYTFGGWKYDDVIYQPGDEFTIMGAAPGVGIALEAVWTSGQATTTATTTTTTTTTVTETSTTTTDNNYLPGDANCDNKIDVSDAVLILQAISNSDKYGLNGTDPTCITAQGMINGDCSGNNDGITTRDALAVQKAVVGLITLPEE